MFTVTVSCNGVRHRYRIVTSVNTFVMVPDTITALTLPSGRGAPRKV